jgi:hypothetical protein
LRASFQRLSAIGLAHQVDDDVDAFERLAGGGRASRPRRAASPTAARSAPRAVSRTSADTAIRPRARRRQRRAHQPVAPAIATPPCITDGSRQSWRRG